MHSPRMRSHEGAAIRWPLPSLVGAAAVLLTAPACRQQEIPASQVVRVQVAEPGDPVPPFAITSPAFGYGEPIPVRYTVDGANLPPPLAWDNVPEGTGAFVLIVEHQELVGTWVHWLVYDIPGITRWLREGSGTLVPLPIGATLGLNSFGVQDYVGPDPPPDGPRRYFFTLYALSVPTGLEAGVRGPEILQVIGDSVLGRAHWMGTY